MGDESESIAAVRRTYADHGIRTRLRDGAVFILRMQGWEGPFAAHELLAVQAEEIDRLEGDARIAAVAALHQTMRRWRARGFPTLLMTQRGFDLEAIFLRSAALRRLLTRAGWDDNAAEVYAGVAQSLHRRGLLLRDLAT